MEAVAAMSRASDGTSSVASEELLAAAEREVRTQGTQRRSLFCRIRKFSILILEFLMSGIIVKGRRKLVQRSSCCLHCFYRLLRQRSFECG